MPSKTCDGVTAIRHPLSDASCFDNSQPACISTLCPDDGCAECDYPLPDIIGEVPAEFLRPQSHGLVRDGDATRCQHILDHPHAERKPVVEPYGMCNHFRRKPMATIERITCRSGHAARSHIFIASRLTLQCPQEASRIFPSADLRSHGSSGKFRRNLPGRHSP